MLSITETDDKISLSVQDSTIMGLTNESEIAELKSFLKNNSKVIIIVYIETGFVCLIVGLVLFIIMLKFLENLFNSINKRDTPFTLENGGYIKKMTYLVIAITISPDAVGLIFEAILKMDL